jgi:hypothetical protein
LGLRFSLLSVSLHRLPSGTGKRLPNGAYDRKTVAQSYTEMKKRSKEISSPTLPSLLGVSILEPAKKGISVGTNTPYSSTNVKEVWLRVPRLEEAE